MKMREYCVCGAAHDGPDCRPCDRETAARARRRAEAHSEREAES